MEAILSEESEVGEALGCCLDTGLMLSEKILPLSILSGSTRIIRGRFYQQSSPPPHTPAPALLPPPQWAAGSHPGPLFSQG